MRRGLIIFLSLVLALVGWSMVYAQDGFYVIPTMKGKYAPVPKTGQSIFGLTGDDGDLQKGVPWPTPRFTDNGNGTVTDNLTKLIWMKNAAALGQKVWADALIAANLLASGTIPGLTDGSKAGDWRLPNVRELQSLIDYGFHTPALPNTLGTGKWEEGDPFQGVRASRYWSSTNSVGFPFFVQFDDGSVNCKLLQVDPLPYVWCVRGGP